MWKAFLKWIYGECKTEGCEKPRHSNSYCKEHAAYLRQNTTLM